MKNYLILFCLFYFTSVYFKSNSSVVYVSFTETRSVFTLQKYLNTQLCKKYNYDKYTWPSVKLRRVPPALNMSCKQCQEQRDTVWLEIKSSCIAYYNNISGCFKVFTSNCTLLLNNECWWVVSSCIVNRSTLCAEIKLPSSRNSLSCNKQLFFFLDSLVVQKLQIKSKKIRKLFQGSYQNILRPWPVSTPRTSEYLWGLLKTKTPPIPNPLKLSS